MCQIDKRLIRPPPQNPRNYVKVFGDAMPIGLVQGFPPANGHEKCVSAMHVLNRKLLSDTTTILNVRNLCQNRKQNHDHAGFFPGQQSSPTKKIFVCHMIKEITDDIKINLKHSRAKVALTMRVLEQAHVSIKKPLKKGTDFLELRKKVIENFAKVLRQRFHIRDVQ